MSRGPDFIIIGAMKCATSTLHEQLAAQPGIFMSDPKEPCYFSDDAIFARGLDWYRSLFQAAPDRALCGESSTHYAKLPDYPRTVERMSQALANVKLIYMMRDPIERLVSQYVHEWTQRTIRGSIDAAVQRWPRLVDYGRYAMQLQPYLDAFGRDRVLPVFQERLKVGPQEELERICDFLGYRGRPVWHEERAAANVSARRMRISPWRDRIVNLPGLRQVRRALVPQGLRERVKSLWMMRERPGLADATLASLRRIYDDDLALLGGWLGIELTCDNFRTVVSTRSLNWMEVTRAAR